MLRLVDPSRTQKVTILDTEFQMRSISVREKFAIIEQLSSLKPEVTSFDHLIDTLCLAIHAIAGNEDVKNVLNQIEQLDDILKIMNGVIEYCSIKDNESKNSASSSGTSTPVPAGN